MLNPPTHDATIARADPSIEADALLRSIRDADWPGDAELLKQRPDGTVCRRTLDGRDVVLKTEPTGGAYRTLQVRVGASRARRAWDGASWLTAHEIRTARPLLLIDGFSDGGRAECIVLEAVEGSTLLDHLEQRPDPARLDGLADAVGRDIAAMFRAGRYNRDHKPSNLIVHPTGPAVTVIDTVAIRPIAPGLEPLERMLASLATEPASTAAEHAWVFVRRAADAVAREILTEHAGLEPAQFAENLIDAVHDRVDRHESPTPQPEPAT